jgi:hypothetical protein
MMDDIFHSEVAQGYIIIYMDDILIATKGDLVTDRSRCHVDGVRVFRGSRLSRQVTWSFKS